MINLAQTTDLSPDKAGTGTFAILAMRGAGKTHLGHVMANEYRKNGVPFVAFDPVGVWWGLGFDADGNAIPDINLTIMGEKHGVMPLELSMAKRLAEIVAEHGTSLVLDFSLMDDEERNEFVTVFANTLYRRNENVLHVFVDEANQFIPQIVGKNEQRMFKAMRKLALLGRNRGVGMTIISQRAANTAKDVLNMCETLIALRTIGERDRDAIDGWISANGSSAQRELMMGSIASLKNGEAWIWSPVDFQLFECVQIKQRETFDSSATPKLGERRFAPQSVQINVDWLMEALGEETPENATQEVVDALQQQIKALRAQLNQKPPVVYIRPASNETLSEMEARAQGIVDFVAGMRVKLADQPDTVIQFPARQVQTEIQWSNVIVPSNPPNDGGEPEPEDENGAGSSVPVTRILDMVRRAPFLLTHSELAVVCGYRSSGGNFRQTVNALIESGKLLKEGVYLSCNVTRLSGESAFTRADVIATWDKKLTVKAERSIFWWCVNTAPQEWTAKRMSEELIYKTPGGNFRQGLTALLNANVLERGNVEHTYRIAEIFQRLNL